MVIVGEAPESDNSDLESDIRAWLEACLDERARAWMSCLVRLLSAKRRIP